MILYCNVGDLPKDNANIIVKIEAKCLQKST